MPVTASDAGSRRAALEGLDVEVVRGAAPQRAVGVHLDEHRGDLEQRIGGGVKAAGLHVDRHRQVAAEAPRHERAAAAGGVGAVDRLRSPACLAGARRQPIRSPARSGTSSSAPNG